MNNGRRLVPSHIPTPSEPVEAKPPPGWTSVFGLLVRSGTLAGAAARGGRLEAQCRRDDCRRRIYIELHEWVERGYGNVPFSVFKRQFQCGRLDRTCDLDFASEREGVTLRLSQLAGKANVRLRLNCGASACKHSHITKPEAVMAGLAAKKGLRNPDVTVDQLPTLLESDCPKCGERHWRVEVLWADITGPAWRRGDRPWRD